MGPQSKSGFCLSWKGKSIIEALEGFTGASITTLLRWRGGGGGGGDTKSPHWVLCCRRGLSVLFLRLSLGWKSQTRRRAVFSVGSCHLCGARMEAGHRGPQLFGFTNLFQVLLPTWGSAGRQGVWLLSPGSPRSLLFPALKEIFLPQISILTFCFYISLAPGV